MSPRITVNSVDWLEVQKTTISGRQAIGGYQFSLQFTCSRRARREEEHARVTNMALSLATKDYMPITLLTPSSTQFNCPAYAGTEYLNFEFLLNGQQLNAIEAYRQGGDLHLQARLVADCWSEGIQHRSDRVDSLTISRQAWLAALRQSGYRHILLFEMPIPNGDQFLAEKIDSAHTLIEEGRYQLAVKVCRVILEHIEKLRGDKELAKAAVRKQSREERESQDLGQRMLRMREQIKNLCHPASHGDEDYTRSQARAILGYTLVLIADPTAGFREPESVIECEDASL